MAPTTNDYDSPWKEALEYYFGPFLAMLAPRLHAHINWQNKPQFLDKELQAITHTARTGRRYADKLVRVHGKNGRPTLILVHVEIQGGNVNGPTATARFSMRMFQYFYRIGERYLSGPAAKAGTPDSSGDTPLLPSNSPTQGKADSAALFSLGVLTQSSGGNRFLTYRQHYLGCGVQFRFPVVHLLEWHKNWGKLEHLAQGNPFALIVMAQLHAQASHDGSERLVSKTALTRLLYGYNYSRDDVLQLLRLIDWIIALPPDLEAAYTDQVDALEQELEMAYVTTFERVSEQRGQTNGTAAVLHAQIQSKFGSLPDWARERIADADVATLRQWALNVLNADSVEAVFDPHK